MKGVLKELWIVLVQKPFTAIWKWFVGAEQGVVERGRGLLLLFIVYPILLICDAILLDWFHQSFLGILKFLAIAGILFAFMVLAIVFRKSRWQLRLYSLLPMLGLLYVTVGMRAPGRLSAWERMQAVKDKLAGNEAVGSTIQVFHKKPCEETDFGGTDPITGKVVVLAGYVLVTDDLYDQYRCFDIRNHPDNPGVDPETLIEIKPMNPVVALAIRKQNAQKKERARQAEEAARVAAAQPTASPEPVSTAAPTVAPPPEPSRAPAIAMAEATAEPEREWEPTVLRRDHRHRR